MPVILALETATKLCSVAVARDGVVLAARDLESDKHVHAEKVNVFIAEVMQEAGLELRALDAVAVGIGPGSYTGLRIGLSAAKGLCYALEIPIMGISTLQTLYASARMHDEHVDTNSWPMIDARRMEVFTQCFSPDGRALSEAAPLVLDAEWAQRAGKAKVFGDGADKADHLWKDASSIVCQQGVRPHASAMTVEALRRAVNRDFDDLAYLVPTYGKAANVTLAKSR